MIKRIAILGCFLLTVFFLVGCGPDAIDSRGRELRLSEQRGKWVVINYWATWCAPCVQTLPELNKLALGYPDKVLVLGVSFDRLDNNVLRQLAAQYNLDYPLFNQFPIQKWSSTPPKNIPVTYIINPKGKLFKVLSGPITLAQFQAVMNLPFVYFE